MIHFRTLLLWISFGLLILLNFYSFDENIKIGIFIRLIPSGFLLLWFLLSIFVKEKLKINAGDLPKYTIWAFKILRPAASISIVTGAVFKLLHLYFGNGFLIIGIGLMAVYSTLLSIYAVDKQDKPTDIVDDVDE